MAYLNSGSLDDLVGRVANYSFVVFVVFVNRRCKRHGFYSAFANKRCKRYSCRNPRKKMMSWRDAIGQFKLVFGARWVIGRKDPVCYETPTIMLPRALHHPISLKLHPTR